MKTKQGAADRRRGRRSAPGPAGSARVLAEQLRPSKRDGEIFRGMQEENR